MADGPRAELAAALDGVKETRLEQITAENFPLSGLEGRLRELSHDLGDGRGFALVRGFPVDGYSYEDIERMYWGFCSHLGTGLTQNGDATFIHYVTDGKLRPSQGRRRSSSTEPSARRNRRLRGIPALRTSSRLRPSPASSLYASRQMEG